MAYKCHKIVLIFCSESRNLARTSLKEHSVRSTFLFWTVFENILNSVWKYFEDFEVGLNFESEPTLVTKDEIIDFASKYDPQSFHLDEKAAKKGPFGQLTSSGFMTLGKSFTQIFKTGVYDGTSMGAWGIDELRWTKPLYPGDLIKTKIIEIIWAMLCLF